MCMVAKRQARSVFRDVVCCTGTSSVSGTRRVKSQIGRKHERSKYYGYASEELIRVLIS